MIARLTWMLSRPGRGSHAVTALPVTAFAIVTTLLLVVIGGAQTFWQPTGSDDDFAYQLLAVVALTLLVVPLGTLGGSAARLAARRRDDRLSTLRLLGATSRDVAAMTVLESGVLALAGSLLGVLGALLVSPLIGLIPFRGEALGAASVIVGPLGTAGVVLGVVALAVVSAVLGLRRVALSPLGVRMRQDAPREPWLKVVIGVVVVAAASLTISSVGGELGVVVFAIMIAGAFGATLAVLNLIGPWVLGKIASGRLRRAQSPVALLSARSILESPKEAWRQVSGTAMASFIAVFAGTGAALLGGAGSGDTLFVDIGTGVLITVIGSFLTVACAVGVNQAASILDRRDLTVSLDRLGVPFDTIDAARRAGVVVPLLVTSIGSAACAVVVILPLAGMALIFAPLSVMVILASLVLGIGLVMLGMLVTRPLLRSSAVVPA